MQIVSAKTLLSASRAGRVTYSLSVGQGVVVGGRRWFVDCSYA